MQKSSRVRARKRRKSKHIQQSEMNEEPMRLWFVLITEGQPVQRSKKGGKSYGCTSTSNTSSWRVTLEHKRRPITFLNLSDP